MSIHPLAGQIAPYETLINVPRLISAYYTHQPDVADSAQRSLRHIRAPRLIAQQQLQRSAYPGR